MRICRKTYISGLDKVPRHKQVLLVRRNLDVVWPDDRLVLVGVVETLDVSQVGDIESSDVYSWLESAT